MNAAFKPSQRTSFRIREELNALPQPERYSDMVQEIDQRREQFKGLVGDGLKDAAREVSQLEADAAAYHTKHDCVFEQSKALTAELIQVLGVERSALITSRQQFHAGPEAQDAARKLAEAKAAATEATAQRIATHLLAKSWGMEDAAPWTFGYPSIDVETRATEILAELQAA